LVQLKLTEEILVE